MILSEILTYVKDNYTYDSDIANSLGEAPTDTQLIPYVNWAVRTIARKTRQISIYIPITLVAGQGSYNLNAGSAISSTNASQVTRVHRVFIGNNVMTKANSNAPGMWAYNEIERFAPNYRAAASGQPIAAAQWGNNLLLYPAPSSNVSSGSGNYSQRQKVINDYNSTIPLSMKVSKKLKSKMSKPSKTSAPRSAGADQNGLGGKKKKPPILY